jgi:HSP20 family protein
MARDTTPHNQRGTRSSASTANSRRAASSETPQHDRQAPIQTGQESGARPRNATPSPAPSRAQGDKLGVGNRQRSGTLSAPVRGASNDPFALMRRMQEDMDQLFSTFGFGRMGLSPAFGSMLSNDLTDLSPRLGRTNTSEGIWSPQVETFRRGDKIVVRADLPGVDKDDVDVSVDNGVLTISGERSAENEDEGDGWYRTERSYGSFRRALPLPEGVTTDQCEATFKDGVLDVLPPAPRQDNTSAKRIPIK